MNSSTSITLQPPPSAGPPAKTARRRKPGNRPKANTAVPPMRGLLPVLLCLLIWQLLGSADSFAYPTPATWFSALGELAADNGLWAALGRTLLTFVLGLLIATVAGVLLGIVVGSSRALDRALSPAMDFFRSLPPPAVIAVILLILGPTYTSALLTVTLGGIWPILLNTAAGVRSVPAIRLEMARSIGMSRFDRFFKVLLPSLTPSIFLGVKVAVSVAFVVTLFIELLGVSDGIGLLMNNRQSLFDSAGVWGLLLVIGVCGYLLNVAIGLTERRLLKNWEVKS